MKRLVLVVSLCLVTLSIPAFGQVPELINYQGRVVVDGTNYDGTADFKFALVDGGSNSAVTAQGTGNVVAGFLVEVIIGDGGFGYVTPPSVTIDDGSGSGASATAFINAGVVTGVTVDVPGGSYSQTPTITFSDPPATITYTTYWSNDGTPSGEPTAAVNLAVNKGLFSVALGDTDFANMTAVPASVFENEEVYLQVWFDDGGGSEQLTPDQRMTAAGYAMMAGQVPPATVTSNMIDWTSMPDGLIDGDSTAAAETDPIFGAASNNVVMDGDTAGGDLSGTYPDPTIAASSIVSNQLDWATMPAGLVDGDDNDDTTYAAGTGLSLEPGNQFVLTNGAVTTAKLVAAAVTSNRINWTSMPAGLVDGDDDTTYTAGSGLNLSGTEFSIPDGAITAAQLVGESNLTSTLIIPNPDPDDSDYFGGAMAMVGSDRFAIASYLDDPDLLTDSGTVRIYDMSGAVVSVLTNAEAASLDRFGVSMARAWDDRLLVGAIGNGEGVVLFDADGNQLQHIPAPANGDFGSAIDTLGSDRLVVGAPMAGGIGYAYLYDTNGIHLATFTNSLLPTVNDRFGGTVACVGDHTVVVGSFGKQWFGRASAGEVIIFETNGMRRIVVTNPTPDAAEVFGSSIASLGDDRFIVGAVNADDGGRSGEAYIYDIAGTLLYTLPRPASSAGGIGADVGTMGDQFVLIGTDDGVHMYDTNAVYIRTITHPEYSGLFGQQLAASGLDRVLVAARTFSEDGVYAVGRGYLFEYASFMDGLMASSIADDSVTTIKMADQSVISSKIYNSAVTEDKIRDNAVTSDKVDDYSLQEKDVVLNTFWETDGNAGTTPGTHFIGTSDNQNFEIQVNSSRAARFKANSTAPTIVFGGTGNVAGAASEGAVIGGGQNNSFGMMSPYVTISGGKNNDSGVGTPYVTIGGGINNEVVGGSYGTIGGGSGNLLSSNTYSVVSGGQANSILIGSSYGVIAGGFLNRMIDNSDYSFIGGGRANMMDGCQYSVLVGGFDNSIDVSSDHAVLVGGTANSIGPSSDYSAIVGGDGNEIGKNNWECFIGGGYNNAISDYSPQSTISGGKNHDISSNASYCTVGGGNANDIAENSDGSTISGGLANNILEDSQYSFIGGGTSHIIQKSSGRAVIVGGSGHEIWENSDYSFVGGGQGNDIKSNSIHSTISGGYQNNIRTNSLYATIPGGYQNEVGASYGVAMGTRAHALHEGAFVWGDSTVTDLESIATDSVTMRADGGYRLFSDSGASVGVELAAGGNSWSIMSDRNVKENFKPVDGKDVLTKLSEMPVTEWNMKTQDDEIRHVGPMAQDFHAAFGLGESERHISSSDADGVALAAIKALYEENRQLRSKVDDLEQQIQSIADQMNSK